MQTITGNFKSDEGRFSIWASTGDVDRMEEIVEPSAFKNLKDYLARNPVILWAHDYDRPPVGKAVGGRIHPEGLVLDIEFAQTEFGREVEYLYREGFLNAFSVGFIPKSPPQPNKEGQYVYTDVELLEVSSVPVPANAAATMIRQAARKGMSLPELEKVLGPLEEAARIRAFARAVR